MYMYFLCVFIFRICTCMYFYMSLKIIIIKSVFPSDVGSNIGSYSVAVAGMHPTREVKLYISIIFLNSSPATCACTNRPQCRHSIFFCSLLLPKSTQLVALLQVIAVDADTVNLAYIRRSLEKNLLWGNGDVRLIHNAVR